MPRFSIARTPAGNFLSIDSSVCNIITANDPEMPRELVLDEQGQEIFRKLPALQIVRHHGGGLLLSVRDRPAVLGVSLVVPSDWSAQHLQKPDNPRTVADFKRALDAAVVKQGVFTLVFHPHKWIKSEQIVELIDHAVDKHGTKVKILNFREAQERLDKNLLAGQPLRDADGGDNGVRLLDLDNDGFQDVVIGNEQLRHTRLWSPRVNKWIDGDFPAAIVAGDKSAGVDQGVRFGVVRDNGMASMLVLNETTTGPGTSTAPSG